MSAKTSKRKVMTELEAMTQANTSRLKKVSGFSKYCARLEIMLPRVTQRELSHFEMCQTCRSLWPLFLYEHHYVNKLDLDEVSKNWAEQPEDRRELLLDKLLRKHSSSTQQLLGKRSPSGYQLFIQEHRPALQRQYPQMKFMEGTAELGRQWSALSAETQAQYNTKAEQAKEERQLKIKELPKFISTLLDNQTRKERAEKRQQRPPKPRNSFLLFVAAQRKNDQKSATMNNRDFIRAQSALWNNMPASEKAPYEEEAQKLKTEYMREKEEMIAQAMLGSNGAYDDEMDASA